eukprot:6027725-Amphidinium_carterae.1
MGNPPGRIMFCAHIRISQPHDTVVLCTAPYKKGWATALHQEKVVAAQLLIPKVNKAGPDTSCWSVGQTPSMQAGMSTTSLPTQSNTLNNMRTHTRTPIKCADTHTHHCWTQRKQSTEHGAQGSYIVPISTKPTHDVDMQTCCMAVHREIIRMPVEICTVPSELRRTSQARRQLLHSTESTHDIQV